VWRQLGGSAVTARRLAFAFEELAKTSPVAAAVRGRAFCVGPSSARGTGRVRCGHLGVESGETAVTVRAVCVLETSGVGATVVFSVLVIDGGHDLGAAGGAQECSDALVSAGVQGSAGG